MMIPAHIVDSNSIAISLMLDGKVNESMRTIRSTLCKLKQIMEASSHEKEDEDEDIHMMDSSSCSSSSSPYATDIDDVVKSIHVPFQQTSSSPLVHGGIFKFFNRAIALDPPRAPENGEHFAFIDGYKVSAVLLYNAGLCCHIKGMQSGLSQDFEQALHFYRFAFSLITETNAIHDVDDNDTLLVLAMSNNMGHLNSNAFDQKATHTCLNVMKNIFPVAEIEILEPEDSLFFYMTCYMVPLEHLSTSPAA